MTEDKTSYAKKLLDLRWKSRRLEILKRDNFQCVNCQYKWELQVHHRYYEDGKEPWEYPDKCLVTLCNPCHGHLHESFVYREFVEDRIINPPERFEKTLHIATIISATIENLHKSHTAWVE